MTSFYESFPYGSSRWANEAEQAPLRVTSGLELGLDEEARVLRHPNDGPAIMIAGSGAGKAVSGGIIANACTYPGSMCIVDLKAEILACSLVGLAHLSKHAYCINPARLLGLPNHSTDPLDILSWDSPTLIPDAKMIAEMLVPLNSHKETYWPEKARLTMEAVMVADLERGGVGGLRSLYRIINAIEGDPEYWMAFAEDAYLSRYEHVRRTIMEIITKLRDAPKEAGAILGEATKCLSFLDDPALLNGLENPSFSLKVLCETPTNVYISVPAEYVGTYAPLIRLVTGVAMLYKQRQPQAKRVVFLIDEAGQLGRADFLLRAMTFGRGAGIQTQAVFQSVGQIAAHYGRERVQTILSSSVVRQFFGVREIETAETVSSMLGMQTLEYASALEQTAAKRNQAHIVRELMSGADVFEAGLNYMQQQRASINRLKMSRALMDSSEVLRMPEDRQILFVSGINCPPIAAWRKPYFLRRSLAGRYLPNPYYGNTTHVRIMGRFGARLARVITEPVPKRFADFPQYQESGLWSYVEGFRPQLEKRR